GGARPSEEPRMQGARREGEPEQASQPSRGRTRRYPTDESTVSSEPGEARVRGRTTGAAAGPATPRVLTVGSYARSFAACLLPRRRRESRSGRPRTPMRREPFHPRETHDVVRHRHQRLATKAEDGGSLEEIVHAEGRPVARSRARR